MRRARRAAELLLSFLFGFSCLAAPPKFEKVSDHCYYFQSKGETANVAAIVSDDGVLLINPSGEPDSAAALDAFKRLTSRPVRWVVNTDYRLARSGGAERFVEQGALVLGSRQINNLASGASDSGPGSAGAAQQEKKSAKAADSVSPSWLVFERQMRVFPGGVEVRIFALQHKAHTGGDVVVFVPAEKVLIVGDLFVAGRYPEIDIAPGDGSALGWLDGMKQAIDSVPLLKAAILQKTEVKPGEEKSLEESVTVISARGPRSNLQDMKDLLDAARKLRGEIAKAVSAGRDIESFLSSPAASPFRSFENLDSFARQLFDALSPK
jgi:glyoxylase-like metal-dependent hydrolase (beta-lactamase superfamily II)